MFATPRADYRTQNGSLPNSYAPGPDRVALLEKRLELVVAENEELTARVVTLERDVISLLAWARALTAPGEPGA
jgi:hypothetical protein